MSFNGGAAGCGRGPQPPLPLRFQSAPRSFVSVYWMFLYRRMGFARETQRVRYPPHAHVGRLCWIAQFPCRLSLLHVVVRSTRDALLSGVSLGERRRA